MLSRSKSGIAAFLPLVCKYSFEGSNKVPFDVTWLVANSLNSFPLLSLASFSTRHHRCRVRPIPRGVGHGLPLVKTRGNLPHFNAFKPELPPQKLESMPQPDRV